MKIRARARLIFAVAGVVTVAVVVVIAMFVTQVVLPAANSVVNVTRVRTVIIVTATPTTGPPVTPEVRYVGVDFASPEDVTALYEKCSIDPSPDCLEVQATGLAGDVLYIDCLLYQVYHVEPNSGEFFFLEGRIVTLTLDPVFPTTALPDPFPNSLRIQP